MIVLTEARMEESLNFLSDSDEQLAQLLADMERAEWRAKATKHAQFLHLTGTVAEREAQASTAPETMAAFDDYFDKVRAYNALRNKRATETIVIDCWRSVNSSRNRGVAY
jgi:hypothetical protein